MTSTFSDNGGAPSPLPRVSFSRMLVDYNPFYLLSAACMVFGLLAMNHSLNWSPIGLRRLVTLIVTLNIYEFALLGLAGFLLPRGIRRDGLLLLIIEAFFLADVGFLNMEIFTTSAHAGLFVNVLLLIVAAIKVAIAFRAVGVPLNDARFVFVC